MGVYPSDITTHIRNLPLVWVIFAIRTDHPNLIKTLNYMLNAIKLQSSAIKCHKTSEMFSSFPHTIPSHTHTFTLKSTVYRFQYE